MANRATITEAEGSLVKVSCSACCSSFYFAPGWPDYCASCGHLFDDHDINNDLSAEGPNELSAE